jgi:hypothetical protein
MHVVQGHAGWVVDELGVLLEGPVGGIPVSGKHCVLVGLHFFLEVSVNVVSLSTIGWRVDPTYEECVTVWGMQIHTYAVSSEELSVARDQLG